MRRYLPILDWLPRYDRRWFPADLIAGAHHQVHRLPEASGVVDTIGRGNNPNVPTAVLALVQRDSEDLLEEDVGAVVTRIGGLLRVAKQHQSQLSEEQRGTLTESLAQRDDLL